MWDQYKAPRRKKMHISFLNIRVAIYTFALKEFFVSLCQLIKPSTTPFKCSCNTSALDLATRALTKPKFA
jgi:hypothetical protein